MQSVNGYVFKSYLLNGDVAIPISPLIKRYCYDIIGLKNVYTGSEYDFLVMSQYVDFDFVDDYLVVMREHKMNDAKNLYSVYKRVVMFHEEVLLSGGAISRAGSLVNKRVARDYISFGLKFLTVSDMKNGKKAIFDAIKLYPSYLFFPKNLVAITLLFIPDTMSKYLLNKFGKLSHLPPNECNW
jgi:hypothetical protein